MSIKKKVNGTEQEIANKSVIDHSQLDNRDAYGAHPISAIRKLPEKLSKLQSNIEEEARIREEEVARLDGRVDQEIADRIEADRIEREARIATDEQLQRNIDAEEEARIAKDNEIESKARQIDVKLADQEGHITFTDYEGQSETMRVSYLPDDDTLQVGNINGNERLTVKQLYTDTDTIVGTGSRPFELDIQNETTKSSTISSFEIDPSAFAAKVHTYDKHIKNNSIVELSFVDPTENNTLIANVTEEELFLDTVPGFVSSDSGIIEVSDESSWKINGIDVTAKQEDIGLVYEGYPTNSDKLSFKYFSGENELSAVAIKDPSSGGIVTPQNIWDKHAEIDEEITNIHKLNETQADQLYHLETVTKGMGGYLSAYDFETATPSQSDLNAYALSQITTITNANDIYNGTKVINLFDRHLWILTNDNGEFEWTNQGQTGIISDANNDGLHGLVTGSDEYLEASIQHNGTIFINGLEDKLDSIDANINRIDANIDEIESDVDYIENNYVTLATDQKISGFKSFTSLGLIGKENLPVYEESSVIYNYEYKVTNLSSPYGFSLNANGYYESNNKGVQNSYALCKVSFTMHEQNDLKIQLINYAESDYDFGIFSNLDQTLTSSNTADTSTTLVKKSYKGIQSASATTLTYSAVPVGDHFITIKYRKDGSVDNSNDSLQFKILSPIGEITKTETVITGYKDNVNVLDVTDDNQFIFNENKVVLAETDQTITGKKTFEEIQVGGLQLKDNAITSAGTISINAQNNKFTLNATEFKSANEVDLGTTENKFKDLHLSGNFLDGTNEINIAQIVEAMTITRL